MSALLEALENHGELRSGERRYCPEVRSELLGMSAATIESKNNHLVRRYGFHWRYDTPEALMRLNRLWPLVNDRFNYFTPTKKPTGWAMTSSGRRKRVYDSPRTPLERLLDAGVLSTPQAEELRTYRSAINPAELARDIQRLQDQLTGLVKRPTLDLVAATTKPAPDTIRGVKLRPTAYP